MKKKFSIMNYLILRIQAGIDILKVRIHDPGFWVGIGHSGFWSQIPTPKFGTFSAGGSNSRTTYSAWPTYLIIGFIWMVFLLFMIYTTL